MHISTLVGSVEGVALQSPDIVWSRFAGRGGCIVEMSTRRLSIHNNARAEQRSVRQDIEAFAVLNTWPTRTPTCELYSFFSMRAHELNIIKSPA